MTEGNLNPLPPSQSEQLSSDQSDQEEELNAGEDDDKSSLLPLREKPFDMSAEQERTRAALARFVLWVQVGILGGIGVFILFVERTALVKAAQSKPATPPNQSSEVIELGDSAFLYVLEKENVSNESNGNKELLTLIWTSQVALVSGALGFYFGSKESH